MKAVSKLYNENYSYFFSIWKFWKELILQFVQDKWRGYETKLWLEIAKYVFMSWLENNYWISITISGFQEKENAKDVLFYCASIVFKVYT